MSLVNEDKLNQAAENLMRETNDMLLDDVNQIIEKVIEKHGDNKLTTSQLITDVIAPMVGQSNSNAKIFALSLMKTVVQIPKD